MKLAAFFQNGTRDGSGHFVKLTDDAPEWLRAAVLDAHEGDTPPNDWTYEECKAIAQAIDDGSVQDEDDLHMYSDARVEVYTKDLMQWVADFCLNDTFHQAQSEYEDTGSKETDIVRRAGGIQYYAIYRIAATIFTAWRDQ